MNTRWDDKEKRPRLDHHDVVIILLPCFAGIIMGGILESILIMLIGLGGSAAVNIIKILKLRAKKWR